MPWRILAHVPQEQLGGLQKVSESVVND